MSSLADSLDQVMAVQGVRAAALIDIDTGMIVPGDGLLLFMDLDANWPRLSWRRS